MFRPPPEMPPSEWAEKNMRIPEGNAKPGPYRVANAPYQREPADMFVDPDCRRVTLQWGAQIGKTLLALLVQGYAVEMRPRSQMMCQPSQGDLQTWLQTKWEPLVESSEGLSRLIAKPRGRDGVNNQRMKSYPGGFMLFAWSGSPKTMRGRSAPLIVCDEVDGYDQTDEGHPVSLLWQRSATFEDERFLLEISTPTLKGASYIEDMFQAGDQRRFYVVCPHCDAHQHLKWSNVTWEGRLSTGLIDYEEDLSHDDHKPETAGYACEFCGVVWNDGERMAAIRQAEAKGAGWKAAKPFKGHASYHLWEAYSLFRRMSGIVRDYLDKLKTDDIQTFVNVCLAETFELKGDRVDPTGLVARAEEYAAEAPMGVLYITAGIDMQQDRLEAEIVGWGEGEESWSLGYHILHGDPMLDDVWEDLDDLLASEFTHETGMRMRIAASCLDTGGTSGYTQRAYEYLKGRTGRRLFGIKGIGGWGRPIVEKGMKKQSGKRLRNVDLFLVGTDEAKLMTMRRLAVEKPGPGYCHVPQGRYDVEGWARQVTSEKLVIRYVKGQPTREWHKPDKARNEALDCRNYATAALKIQAPSFKRIRERMMSHPRAQQVAETPEPAQKQVQLMRQAAPEPAEIPDMETAPVKPQNTVIKRSAAARRGSGSNWVTGWK
ncbi:head, terminase DNA packaging protein A [Xanthomonas phage FoX3]|uniref:Terminase, large subunit n=1 Tax=Xanthomonas phage FoX3 TaxID=2723899 RepID=A0A858NQF4_9CAUD|nr:terminase large subunit [Xanthomonas phage FoX3]QJB21903.1 head, terminase DNA packaging protein A [Xanthomonas phage FoX3]